MNKKIDTLKFFFISLLISVLTIYLYNLIYNVPTPNYTVAILNCFFSTLTMVIVLEIVFKMADKVGYTGASFLLIVSVLYNQISIVKFSAPYLFEGYISDTNQRFLGNLYIDFVIIASAIIVYIVNKRSKNNSKSFYKNYSIPLYFSYILSLMYGFLNLIMFIATGQTLANDLSRVMQTINSIFQCFCYTVVAITFDHDEKGRPKTLTLIPVLIVIINGFLLALLSGKKSAIVLPIYAIMFTLLFVHKISKKQVMIVCAILPMLYRILSDMSNIVSSRMSAFSLMFKLQYNGFRFDLSDFAITIASRFHVYPHPFTVLKEAIEYALPSFINTSKPDSLIYYQSQLEGLGIADAHTQDFNDTLFSMGAQIGGYIGIFLTFLVILLFFNWLSKRLQKGNRVLNFVCILLITYFSTIESDWSMFIWNTRDMLLYILIGYLIFNILLRKKKRRVS